MEVIIINGPMGVGKTTVGKYIAEKCPGTAFVDGDWCMDIHPFVGNRETKSMAISNILHMIQNYKECSLCHMIVLVWLMDDEWVRSALVEGIGNIGLETKSVTLICDEKHLTERWNGDTKCNWRNSEWLQISKKSLAHFSALENCIDTNGLTIEEVADQIIMQ